jgi:prepilin-type N-terminal cleavage/methylation domain-containing protein
MIRAGTAGTQIYRRTAMYRKQSGFTLVEIAIVLVIIGLLLGVLVWQIWRLIKMVQTEIKPILTDAQETVNTVRGTTTFMSDTVVDPVVKTSRTLVGIRRTVQSLTADLKSKRR